MLPDDEWDKQLVLNHPASKCTPSIDICISGEQQQFKMYICIRSPLGNLRQYLFLTVSCWHFSSWWVSFLTDEARTQSAEVFLSHNTFQKDPSHGCCFLTKLEGNTSWGKIKRKVNFQLLLVGELCPHCRVSNCGSQTNSGLLYFI